MDRRTLLLGMTGATFATPIAAQAPTHQAPPNPAPPKVMPPKAADDAKEEAPLGQKILEQFAASLSAHDLKAFGNLFAETFVNHRTGAAAPPTDAKEGKQLVLAMFAARLKALPDLTVKIEAMVATDDDAAASFVFEGTHAGVYLGFEPTGRRLRFTSCDIFAIRGGRIAEHWGVGDIAGVIAQLRG
jgi:predicted ester cyclase